MRAPAATLPTALPFRPAAFPAAPTANTPSPLLAGLPPAAALADVQSPLIAVGDDAAGKGGINLMGLRGKALPGLVVVLATALVAAVGAGNMRIWQDRIAARNGV